MTKEAGRWFRFYDGVLNNAKVQRVPPPLFRAWVNVLCLANQRGGTFTEDAVAFALRIPVEEARAVITALVDANLLERLPRDLLRPHDWNLHQYQSDHSAERTDQYRKRLQAKTTPGTPPGTSSGTPPGKASTVTGDGKRKRRPTVTRDGAVTLQNRAEQNQIQSQNRTESDSEQKKDSASQALAAPSAGGGLVDLKREVFTRGLMFLKTYGLDDNHARKILGRWRRDHGDAALINVLASAEANSVSDLVPYVEKTLRKGFSHGTGLDYHPGGIFAGLAEKFREVEESHRR